MGFPTSDKLIASAASYLIEGQELYEASILLLSNLEISTGSEDYGTVSEVYVELLGSRTIHEVIQDQEHPATLAIRRAINAVLPSGYHLDTLTSHVEFSNFDSNWRSKLLEVIEGKLPLNQCLPIQDKPRYPWEHLFFRSPYEIAIAKALDDCKVLFLPNCMARFSSPNPRERKNREADFLICYDGKWGILEIDGETYHPIAAKDHERDRLFKAYGIRVIERYTANQCLNNPKGVIQEFLDILKKNG